MIPVMLCTLTIGTVLPEPHRPKHYVLIQLLEWTSRAEAFEEDEPPECAAVAAELRIPLGDERRRTGRVPIEFEAGSIIPSKEFIAIVSAGSPAGRNFQADVTAVCSHHSAGCNGGRMKSRAGIPLRLGVRFWLGNIASGRGIVIHLYRDK